MSSIWEDVLVELLLDGYQDFAVFVCTLVHTSICYVAKGSGNMVLQWFPAKRVWYRAFSMSVYLSNLFALDLSWILILVFLEIYRRVVEGHSLSGSMIFTRWEKLSRILFFLFFWKNTLHSREFHFQSDSKCGWREWTHVVKIIKILRDNFHIRDIKAQKNFQFGFQIPFSKYKCHVCRTSFYDSFSCVR